mmetsp:Transcript_9543/g.23790  ORF Transcript_9543/g.23790 Transcript_9543/m.23790 type:complete len:86 (-) Transcript_9543:779-1036(-)
MHRLFEFFTKYDFTKYDFRTADIDSDNKPNVAATVLDSSRRLFLFPGDVLGCGSGRRPLRQEWVKELTQRGHCRGLLGARLGSAV